MMDFIETYASFEQAGGVEAALAVLAFAPQIVERMQIDGGRSWRRLSRLLRSSSRTRPLL